MWIKHSSPLILRTLTLGGQISLATTVSYCNGQKVYNVPVIVTDACGFSRTSTLTVSITEVCDPPVLNNLPLTVLVTEGLTSKTKFHTLTITSFSCYAPTYKIVSVDPWQASYIFSIDQRSKSSIYLVLTKLY